MKLLTILGSTGSIGTQALDIVRNRPEDFKILALSAHKNIQLFIDQIKEFKPHFVTIFEDGHKKQIQELFPQITVLKNIKEIASLSFDDLSDEIKNKIFSSDQNSFIYHNKKIDIVLSAIVGIAGLEANLEALKNARRVAVANKETLVSAGHLVREYCAKYNSELIPVDSEHVAIHQCLYGNNIVSENSGSLITYKNKINNSIKEILLTSSGGPFRTLAQEDFMKITLKDALKHPTWNMGAKITVDSSTLMNKALEIIEVNSLFGIDYEQIKVVIHPQSIVHSAVTFIDGTTVAQMGSPNMRVPIQYALDFPDKLPLAVKDDFDIFKTAKLEFFEPDCEKFPALKLAYKVGEQGHSYPTVFNSANEIAVDLFINELIRYVDVLGIIEEAVSGHKAINKPNLEDILSIDDELKSQIKSKARS